MSFGEKPSRELIRKHAPWFNLRNYDALSRAALGDWYEQFALRIDLRRIRSLLFAPEHECSAMHRSVHSGLVTLLRTHGVVTSEQLEVCLRGEEFLYPETFSVLRSVSAEGLYLRPMTLNDYVRIRGDLKPGSLRGAHAGWREALGELSSDETSCPSEREEMQTPLNEQLNFFSVRPTEAFLRVDLRLPRSLIKKQLEEVVDRLSQRVGPLLPAKTQTRLPTPKAWVKSKVLPFVDLSQWLETAEPELVKRISKADIAAALELDPKQMTDTTEQHAAELTDPLSWTFMHLAETAISSMRNPIAPLRQPKRRNRR